MGCNSSKSNSKAEEQAKIAAAIKIETAPVPATDVNDPSIVVAADAANDSNDKADVVPDDKPDPSVVVAADTENDSNNETGVVFDDKPEEDNLNDNIEIEEVDHLDEMMKQDPSGRDPDGMPPLEDPPGSPAEPPSASMTSLASSSDGISVPLMEAKMGRTGKDPSIRPKKDPSITMGTTAS